jgi:hypothetical protein
MKGRVLMSFHGFRALLRAIRQWLVDAGSGCWCRARPAAHEARETFREGLLAARRQAGEAFIDGAETACKEAVANLAAALRQAIFPTPPGESPAGL